MRLPKTLIQEIEIVCQDAGQDGSVRVIDMQPVSGGCINQCYRLSLKDGRRWFLKLNPQAKPDFFAAEATGLVALGNNQSGPRVPKVIKHGTLHSNQRPFLIIEWIEQGKRGPSFFEDFGRSLAELHRAAAEHRFGFQIDTYIGSTPQSNRWQSNWTDFFIHQRLESQLQLARSQGYTDLLAQNRRDIFFSQIQQLLATVNEPPALIHGDLWSGNYLIDQAGGAVLIDPAVYYASREAEFGMTLLFGGLGESFYAAYREAYPFQDGYDSRFAIYKLYHLLNHLNLFGSSYLAGCQTIIHRFSERDCLP
jgi:fructosamine-3-kinase